MSSGRLGPPSRAPSCRRRRKLREPARAREQVHGLADDRALEGLPGPGGVRGGRGRAVAAGAVRRRAPWPSCPPPPLPVPSSSLASASPAWPRGWWRSRSSWTHSRTRSSSAPGSTSPVTNGTIAASHATASAASPSSQAPPPPAAGGGAGAVPGPLRPDPRRPLLQQRRAALQPHQVGQGDVHHGLNRLPGPLRQQPGADQPPHRLLQSVMAALRLAPGILRPGRGRQRIQHRGHHRRRTPGTGPRSAPRHPRTWSPARTGRERLILLAAPSWPSSASPSPSLILSLGRERA